MSAWMWGNLQGLTPKQRATGNQSFLRVKKSIFSMDKPI